MTAHDNQNPLYVWIAMFCFLQRQSHYDIFSASDDQSIVSITNYLCREERYIPQFCFSSFGFANS